MGVVVYAVVCPLLVASIIGGVVMYGDLQTAKANSAVATKTNDKQDEKISEIPAITAIAASMARTVQTLANDQKAFMKKVDEHIVEAAERDAKFHHGHNPR
jgi:Flp pilus assembly protein protease CpaA